MTPKIIFKYSWIYDQIWKECIKTYKLKDKTYPSPEKIQNYIKKVEILWRKDEKKVLAECAGVTGLKWKEKIITCYVVGRSRDISDPVTVRLRNDPDRFIGSLTHELIHQLLPWKYFYEKYQDEPFNTRLHIPVHAIHWHIYLKFFSKKRLKRNIELDSEYPEYKRAWDIVEKEGYLNIIQSLKEKV